jgi:hypothetical protein
MHQLEAKIALSDSQCTRRAHDDSHAHATRTASIGTALKSMMICTGELLAGDNIGFLRRLVARERNIVKPRISEAPFSYQRVA